jgi:hypothetical protein
MSKSKKHGGTRPGSGRPQKAGEPTVVMRVPVSLVEKVEKMIERLKNKKPLK